MEFKTRSTEGSSDGFTFRCPDCKTMKSIRHNSFFTKSRLTLQKWLLMMQMWSRERPVGDAADEAEISECTAIDIYQWFREVWSTKLLSEARANPNVVKLGGPGVVVQIDESMFSHKPKNHRGRPARSENWVFGMVDTSRNPALGVMRLVPRRDAATLLPIIKDWCLSGTIIYFDEGAAYNRINTLPNITQHQHVNHSLHFVDPATGVHTQNIESYWNNVKTKLKRMRRCHSDHLESYLDEHMWRERYGSTHRQAFQGLCQCIAEIYPV